MGFELRNFNLTRISLIIISASQIAFCGVYDRNFGINSCSGTISGGLFGFNLEYQMPYLPKNRITATLGTGFCDFTSLGYSIGIMHEYGFEHRVFTGLTFGTLFMEYEDSYSTIDGESHKKNLLFGPSVIGGYKRVCQSGFMFNLGGGISYPLNPKLLNNSVKPSLTIGFGYKFGKNTKNKNPTTESNLPSKYKFLRNLGDINFMVTNPKFLVTNRTDTSNALYNVINERVNEKLSQYSLVNFKELPDIINRKVTVAFNSIASKNNGIVDTLPYTIWEYCKDNKIATFATFYIYKESESAEIEKKVTVNITFPVPTLLGTALITTPINIDYDNIQIGFAVYDVDKNRMLLTGSSNDEDYENPLELIEDLFQEMGIK
jgi:hypothetical protein